MLWENYDKNLVFFCMTTNENVEAKLTKLSPISPVTAIIEPVDLQTTDRDGKSLSICMAVLYDIK